MIMAESTHELKIERQDLHGQVTAILANLITDSEPNSKLPTERELSEMIGVGRSTVREAVRSLAFIGAITVRQGDGIYVSHPDRTTVERLIGLGLMMQRSKISEVIEARSVLEVEAVRLTAVRRSEEEASALVDNIRLMKETVQGPTEASRLDLEFHVLMARGSHNSVLVHFLNGMRGLLEVWINQAVNDRRIVADVLEEHQSIVQAVVDKDPDLAADQMRVHMHNAGERLLATVDEDQAMAQILPEILASRRTT